MHAPPPIFGSLLVAVAVATVLGFAVMRSRRTGSDAARSAAWVALVAVVASLATAVAYWLDPQGARFAEEFARATVAILVLFGVVLLVWLVSTIAAAFNRFLDKR